MTDARFLTRRLSLSTHDASDGRDSHARSVQGGGIVAVAKDSARQHVGDVINNYFGNSLRDKVEHQWFEIIEWLLPPEAANDLQKVIHKEARNNHEPATGQWFTDDAPLRRWISGDEPLRWLCGSVGCGKTVLFSSAVEETRKRIRSEPQQRFGYFYCSSRDTWGQDLEVLLRLLIVQLCPPSQVPEPLKSLYQICRDVYPPKVPTFLELKVCLQDLVRVHARETNVYLLIDALDEIPWESRDDVFDVLEAIADQDPFNVHLLVTSRDRAYIRDALSEPLDWKEITVEEHLVQADIRRYVSNAIEADRRLRSLSASLKQNILKRVGDEGRGMFLWAALSVKALKRIRVVTDERIRQCLVDLPEDLPRTYLKILCEIDDYFTPQASRALAWLVFSARRMYIEEIADACSFDLVKGALLTERLRPANIYELLSDVITIQPPLSTQKEIMKPRYHTVILAHASVGEFLLKTLPSLDFNTSEQAKRFQLDSVTANETIAQTCLAYLLQYNSFQKRHEDYPLRIYAWYNWEKHLPVEKDDQCPVRDSFVVRRRAVQLYRALQQIEAFSDHPLVVIRDNLKQINAMKKATKWLANSRLRWQLREAMNVPFFHENFDAMFPSGYLTDNVYDTFVHDSLEWTQKKPIRVLEILPCLDESTPVRGAILHTTLEDAPRYIALSYEWGHKTGQEYAEPAGEPEMLVSGLKVELRPNLLRMLRLLRSRVEESQPAIWVDAICIDQSNVYEKGHQVSIIGEIFASATNVIVRLNDTAGTAEKGIEYLNRIAAAVSANRNQAHEDERVMFRALAFLLKPSGAWDAVFDLFNDTWWQRMWIVQEVILSSNAIFLTGSASFSFKALEALAYLEALSRKVLSSSSSLLHRFRYDLGWTAAKNILQTRLECSQPTRPALPVLFWRFRNHRCTLIQEKIYALLGMCDPQKTPPRNLVDYGRGAAETYGSFLRWYIEEYRNLDILSLCIPSRQDSWKGYYRGHRSEIPHWYSQIFNNTNNDAVRECRPLTLGTFNGGRAMDMYTAGGDDTVPSVVDCLTASSDDLDWTELALFGASFDTIREVVAIAAEGAYVSRVSLDHARNLLVQFGIEAFWRTLLADQWPVGQRLPQVSHFWEIRNPPTLPDHDKRLPDVAALEYNMPFLTGRSVVITLAGRIGLAPKSAEPGDEIVVMPGGSVPLILRKKIGVLHLIVERNPYYFLIGECYIHGCMNGEIPRQLAPENGEYWKKRFILI